MGKNEYKLNEIPIKVNKKIKDVLEVYDKLMVPRQALLEDYLAVITTDPLAEAANAWIYLHRGIHKQSVEHGVSKLESAFIFGAMKLRDEKPTDVIRAAFYKNRNDSAYECGVLLREYY